jgi:hypothetical protein
MHPFGGPDVPCGPLGPSGSSGPSGPLGPSGPDPEPNSILIASTTNKQVNDGDNKDIHNIYDVNKKEAETVSNVKDEQEYINLRNRMDISIDTLIKSYPFVYTGNWNKDMTLIHYKIELGKNETFIEELAKKGVDTKKFCKPFIIKTIDGKSYPLDKVLFPVGVEGYQPYSV